VVGIAHARCVGCWESEIVIGGCDVQSMHSVTRHVQRIILATLREKKDVLTRQAMYV
jgi:hypothetical protein